MVNDLHIGGGDNAKDEGIDRVLSKEEVHTNWISSIRNLIAGYPPGKEFGSDDVRIDAAKARIADPHHPNCWGGVFQRAAKSGLIKRIGNKNNRLTVTHSHEIKVWKRDMNPLSLDSVRSCTQCPSLGQDQVPSDGDPQARLMVIGQNPGHQEVKEGRPFVGPSGELVGYLLDEIGLDRSEVYLANAVKCGTISNRSPHPEEMRTCWQTWLFSEIKLVDPDVILLLGKVAHEAVVHGRHPFKHGTTFSNKKYTFVCSWHPSYCLRTGQEELFVSGIGGLVAESLLEPEETE